MQINQKGIDLIKQFEGFRAKAYIDAVGVLTIGYGTTGNRVYHGQSISQETAEDWLFEDCRKFEEAINNSVKVPLTSNQFSALVCFTYNVGSGAFQSSTLLKKLNRRDYSGACAELDKWVKGNNQILPGLVKRRDAEQALFKLSEGTSAPVQTHDVSSVKHIQILKDTYFKRDAVQSATLDEPDGKIKIYQGTELPVLAQKPREKHTFFTFGFNGQPIKLAGKNSWFVWNEHFKPVGGQVLPPSNQTKPQTLADKIASTCKSKGYSLDKSEYNLVVISGLSPTPNRGEGYGLNATPDKWNDSVLILAWDGAEWDILAFYRATAEPGRHYVQNPLNRNGAAVLDLGFHKNLWHFGLHRGYRALTQAGQVRLMREKNKNHQRDDTITVETGNGINLHTTKTTGWRGSYSEASIGTWSAGCVVVTNPTEFKAILGLMEKSPQYRKNPSCCFDVRVLAATWL